MRSWHKSGRASLPARKRGNRGLRPGRQAAFVHGE